MSRIRKVFKDVEDAETLKAKGNTAFMAREYSNAIQYYSAAIRISPNTSVLFSNRARCYYLLKDFHNSLKDSKNSVELDENNLKAHLLFIRSLANVSRQSLDLANVIKALESCNSLYDRAVALKQEEYKPVCKAVKKKIKTLIFLKKSEMFNYKISRLKNHYKNSIKSEKYKKMFSKYLNEKPLLPISEAFFCPITLELFSDPLITCFGNTFDEESLKSHFSKMGVTDPITRQAVNPFQIFNNLAVRKAVKWLKKTSPWAVYSENPITSLDVEV
jgi:tetratricopeptide (TPR) repeat protein